MPCRLLQVKYLGHILRISCLPSIGYNGSVDALAQYRLYINSRPCRFNQLSFIPTWHSEETSSPTWQSQLTRVCAYTSIATMCSCYDLPVIGNWQYIFPLRKSSLELKHFMPTRSTRRYNLEWRTAPYSRAKTAPTLRLLSTYIGDLFEWRIGSFSLEVFASV